MDVIPHLLVTLKKLSTNFLKYYFNKTFKKYAHIIGALTTFRGKF